jgi:hypothetical protein
MYSKGHLGNLGYPILSLKKPPAGWRPGPKISKAWIYGIVYYIQESARKHKTNTLQGYSDSSGSVESEDEVLEVLAEHSTEPGFI